MRTTWITAPTVCLLTLAALACHREPTCEPGDHDPRCAAVIGDPTPALGEREAQAHLADIHAEYQRASVDGLNADECRQLSERYQALYDRDNTIVTARFNVAVIHQACGQTELAGQIYAQLCELEHPQALNNQGVLAWLAGDQSRAMSLFERAVAADTTHALEARNNLAMAQRERYASTAAISDFERAQAQLQRILAVDSSNRVAYENLARLYYDRGRRGDKSYLVLAHLVVTQGQRVLETTGRSSADLHNLRGLLLIEDDDQVQALRAFMRAVEIDPEHADANRNIAMVAIRFRDYATAERSLESVLDAAIVAADVDAWIALGVAKRGLRKYGEAEQAYRHAIEIDSSDPRPWYNLGILSQEHLSASADDEQALIADYERALAHYQTFIDTAGSVPRWRDPVNDAKDRVAVVKDSIASIEMIKANQRVFDDMMLLEEQQRLEELERRKRLEDEAMSLHELLDK
jgi:tetratricopeptide (TPR) repeat protein